MVHQILDIKRDVRVCMDENRTTTSLLSAADQETLSLDELITRNVLEAVRRVHMEAPYWMPDNGTAFGSGGVVWHNDHSGQPDTCGHITLPGDFMRLVVFEMSDWERPVYAAITTDDPLYAKQKSRHKGVRGNPQRPVVAIGVTAAGRTLEFWSCKTQLATVSRGLYLPYPTEDAMGGIDIAEPCYRAVVYMTAGLVKTAQGEAERAKNYFEMAKSLIQ